MEKDSTVSPQSSELEEFEREEEEGGEDGSHEFRVWKMADQIQLLKPGPVGLEEQLGEEDDEEEEEETESEKKEEEPSPRPTAADEGKGEEEREEEKAVLVRGRVRLGGDLSLGTQPPWLEMVSNRNGGREEFQLLGRLGFIYLSCNLKLQCKCM